MPVRNIQLDTGTIYIKGCECKGIPDFECTEEAKANLNREISRRSYIKSIDSGGVTLTCKIRRILALKLIGLWDWAYKHCSNRRLTHLMNHGKNDKVKLKNFYRALRTIAKESAN